MNLTFVFDGYLAQTALESSFQLFVFDGYLIYGEIPPPSGGAPTIRVPRKKGGTGDKDSLDEDAGAWKKRMMQQSSENWIAILKAFLECQN